MAITPTKKKAYAKPGAILSPADCVCITVGVTAHRDLATVDKDLLRQKVREFFMQLQNDFPKLPIKLLNALAEGGDRLVAEVAIELGIELIIPLPMPCAEYEKDFTSEASRAEFRELCNRYDVTELPIVEGSTLETIAQNPEARGRQYAQLGVFISSHSQILLALWDGKWSEKLGGAASVVHFRLNDYMPGYMEPEVTAQLLADNENDLVYHIVCPRADRPTSAQPLSTVWLSDQGEQRSESMPPPILFRAG